MEEDHVSCILPSRDIPEDIAEEALDAYETPLPIFASFGGFKPPTRPQSPKRTAGGERFGDGGGAMMEPRSAARVGGEVRRFVGESGSSSCLFSCISRKACLRQRPPSTRPSAGRLAGTV